VSVETWLAALSRLYPVPAGYRSPLLSVTEAADVLRCGTEAFTELLAAGLPCDEGPDGPLFDRDDLTNLALDAGTGESRPERAVRYALRWMREDPRGWATPLSWSFSVTMAAPAGSPAGSPESWSHTRFLPELGGGLIEDWQSTPGVRITPAHFEFDGPGPVSFSGHIKTAGKVQELVSPTLRKLTSEFLGQRYRWVRLPEACQHDYEPLLARGVAPCVAASTFLAKEFRAAGYDARTRGGWILGMLDLAHSWVEVVDDDGVVKPVDAVLERLSGLADSPHPDLADACLGSRINRMLPAAMPAGAPESRHHTAGTSRPAITRTVIRRVGAR
jgi:hypothetical protein